MSLNTHKKKITDLWHLLSTKFVAVPVPFQVGWGYWEMCVMMLAC